MPLFSFTDHIQKVQCPECRRDIMGRAFGFERHKKENRSQSNQYNNLNLVNASNIYLFSNDGKYTNDQTSETDYWTTIWHQWQHNRTIIFTFNRKLLLHCSSYYASDHVWKYSGGVTAVGVTQSSCYETLMTLEPDHNNSDGVFCWFRDFYVDLLRMELTLRSVIFNKFPVISYTNKNIES